jgi:uncharacterized protein (DUF2147 family)
MKKTTLMVAVCFFLSMCHALAFEGDDVIGVWNTSDNDGQIEIFRCGDKYCGRIVSTREPCYPPDDDRGMGGQPRIDRNNPDPALRTRPILGLTIMEAFTFCGENQWKGGKIYDPGSGNTYKCKMSLSSLDRLKVRGFIGISLFGRTSVWTRKTDECQLSKTQ